MVQTTTPHFVILFLIYELNFGPRTQNIAYSCASVHLKIIIPAVESDVLGLWIIRHKPRCCSAFWSAQGDCNLSHNLWSCIAVMCTSHSLFSEHILGLYYGKTAFKVL